MPAVTLLSLLTPSARAAGDDFPGFRFCASPACPVAWFRPENARVFEKKDLRDVQKNAEYCVRGQSAGRLSQEDFDEFVEKINRFAERTSA